MTLNPSMSLSVTTTAGSRTLTPGELYFYFCFFLNFLHFDIYFFSFPLTSWRGLAEQLGDVPLQQDQSALQRAGAAAHGHQLPLQLLQDAHRVPGQIRELPQHRAQGCAAYVRQLPEHLRPQRPAAAAAVGLAHIFGENGALAERHSFSTDSYTLIKEEKKDKQKLQ